MSDQFGNRSANPSAILPRLSVLTFFVLLLNVSASAQYSRTIHDGYTPTGVEQGAAAGSYPLSGFESVNLYNGMLNVAFPLVRVGGRGSAGYTMTLQLDKHWELYRYYEDESGVNVLQEASFQAGRSWMVGYGPGVMIGMKTADKTPAPTSGLPCGYPPYHYYVNYLTRLTFVMPDGSEVLLHDKLYQGLSDNKDLCTFPQNGLNRGKVFVSSDGESMTFISDGDISDDLNANLTWEFLPSGHLLMKDGTRYRIESGRVSWIRDHNGNKVSFSYETLTPFTWRLLTATDSLNRQVSISYATTSPGYDEISFKGFGVAQRSIKVWYNQMQNMLYPGATIKKGNQLFPEVYDGGNGWTGDWDMNGTLVSKIELPDQRTYQFLYNSYGEIARIILPTGGGFDYEHEASAGGGLSLYGLTIYRRVVKRTVYNTLTPTTDPNNPPAGTREKIENYVVETPQSANTTVRVEVRDGNNVLTAQSKHYFYANPKFSGDESKTPVCYSWWAAGKEYQTESFNVSGGTAGPVLRKSEQIWSPTVGTGSEGICYGVPAPAPRIAETITTLADTNQLAKQSFSYDQYNNQTDVYEYDYGTGAPGALVRRTHTDYLTSGYDTIAGGISNPNATDTIHIRSFPTQQQVFGYETGSEKLRAQTSYEYDNYNQSGSDVFHAALTDRASISGLVSRNNIAPGAQYSPTTDYSRGNVTKTTRYLLDANGNVTGSISSYAQYDIAGNVVKAIDPRSTTNNIIATIFDFSDRYGSPDGDARANAGATELGTQISYAFPTKVTNALGHEAYTQFDYYLGKPVDSEDPNGVKASTYYEDALDRPTKAIRAVGTAANSQTNIRYDDANRLITTTSDKDTFGESGPPTWGGIKGEVLYDGLGRTVENRSYETGTAYITIKTVYDALGRVTQVSNPYRAGETVLWTTTTYDALSRVVSVKTPDQTGSLPGITTAYSGNRVLVTDQAGKQRLSQTNALGQLTDVWEITPADSATEAVSFPNHSEVTAGYRTKYEYNALANLTKVTQQIGTSGTTQTRTFAYDSLSRLTSATNPENGTTSYTYDPNGNLLTKTDARSVAATYIYDALNRNTTVTYNDGTPAVTRSYDQATLGKGRLYRSETATGNGTQVTIPAYDALGRPLTQEQQFFHNGGWSSPYTTQRSYNLAGAVLTQTYPSGRTITNAYDGAGRLNSFSGNLGGVPLSYTTNIAYNPRGQMIAEQFGTAATLYLNRHFNSRGQLYDVRVGTNPGDEWTWNRGALRFYYSTDYAYGEGGLNNNGNVWRMDHFIPLDEGTTDWVASVDYYGYDALNRITGIWEQSYSYVGGAMTFNGSIFTQQYLYDRWGNRTVNNAVSNVPGVFNLPLEVETTTNRLRAPNNDCSGSNPNCLDYDAAGNQTKDRYSAAGGGGSRSYDAENRMKAAQSGGVWHYYVYDADGRRVRRTIGTNPTVWQVYGMEGELLAEYTAGAAATSPTKEYGYRTGQLLVMAEGSNIKWLVADHLGTPRMIIDKSGSLLDDAGTSQVYEGVMRHDYLPFGEEVEANVGVRTQPTGYANALDTTRQKFGSKERDTETGLDYFINRYYASVQGRFTGVDEFSPILGKQGADDKEEGEKEFRRWLLQPARWNRYAYALNNPLRHIDPDGMDTITVNLNIIYDANSTYTEEEKERIRQTYIEQAKKNFGNVDIQFNVTETTGTAADLGDENRQTIDSQSYKENAINVFFTRKDVAKGLFPPTESTQHSTGSIFISTGKGANPRDLTHGIIHALGVARGVNGYNKVTAELTTEYAQYRLSSGHRPAYVDNRPLAKFYGYAQAKVGSLPESHDVRSGFDVIRDGARRYLQK